MSARKKSLESGQPRVNDADAPWQALARALAARGPAARPLEPVAHAAARLCGAEVVILLLRDGERLVLLGSEGLESRGDRGRILGYGRRIAAWMETSQQSVAVADPAQDPRFDDPPSLASVAAMPLHRGVCVAGAIVCMSEGGAPLDASPLEPLARALGVRLERDALRALAAELEQDRDRLEGERLRSDRLAAAGELAADIAEEIKAPLAALGGIARKLREDAVDAGERAGYLELLVHEVARLDRLLGDQLTLTRHREPELRPENPNHLVEECLEMIGPRVRETGIHILKRLGSSVPELLIEPDLFRRVVLNLLRSAVESARPDGRVRIESVRDGGRVELRVYADGPRDTGLVLERMWTPFLAGDEERNGDVLTRAVQRILDEHGGRLTVDSNERWALQFTLSLPIPENRDRRRTLRDRRSGRRRRRI